MEFSSSEILILLDFLLSVLTTFLLYTVLGATDKKNNKKHMLGYFQLETSLFLLNANFMEYAIQIQRIRDFNL